MFSLVKKWLNLAILFKGMKRSKKAYKGVNKCIKLDNLLKKTYSINMTKEQQSRMYITQEIREILRKKGIDNREVIDSIVAATGYCIGYITKEQLREAYKAVSSLIERFPENPYYRLASLCSKESISYYDFKKEKDYLDNLNKRG